MAAMEGRLSAAMRHIATVLDGPGMFVVALVDSSFFTLPELNDFLIVLLSIDKPLDRVAYYVLMTAAGSVIGSLALYYAGRKGGNPVLRRRFSAESVDKVESLFRRYGPAAVIIPCLLPPPCPFKLFVLTAGVLRYSSPAFVISVAVGRIVRYSLWGVLSYLYGDHVRDFMQQKLNEVGLVLLAVAVVAVTVAVAFRLRRRRHPAE
jgi:membrane protein DedA with SNARE-associated domain